MLAAGSSASLQLSKAGVISVLTIGQVLHRRADLSTFLVHLTRTNDDGGPLDNLRAMLTAGRIEARNAMGWAAGRTIELGAVASASQAAVCFSEAPLDQLYSLAADIKGRRFKLEPYGLVFTKMVARRKGANPIWYVDMTPSGREWLISQALNALLDEAAAGGDTGFASHHAAAIFPFMEQMGTWPSKGRRRNSGGSANGATWATSRFAAGSSHSCLHQRSFTRI